MEEQQSELPFSGASSSSLGDPDNPPPYNALLTLNELITHLEYFKEGVPVLTLISGDKRRQLVIYVQGAANPHLHLRVDEAVRHCEDVERRRVNNLAQQRVGLPIRFPPRPRVADREGQRIYFTWSPGPPVQN
uniref:Uncharacterized protein n=1 Tax=Meloidogyne hapla TaxID=6305 RepID=A0A1I8BSV5_MELHA